MKKKFLIFAAVMTFATSTVAASWWDGYKLSSRNNIVLSSVANSVAGKWNSGFRVINNSSVGHFVPTKNKDGWNSFLAHLPSGVEIETREKYILSNKLCLGGACRKEAYSCGKNTCYRTKCGKPTCTTSYTTKYRWRKGYWK